MANENRYTYTLTLPPELGEGFEKLAARRPGPQRGARARLLRDMIRHELARQRHEQVDSSSPD